MSDDVTSDEPVRFVFNPMAGFLPERASTREVCAKPTEVLATRVEAEDSGCTRDIVFGGPTGLGGC